MRIFFFLLLVTATLGASAQQVSGITKDGEGKPVSGVTISLLADTGAKVIKLAVSKENGLYNFNEIKAGQYRVSATHIGYQPAVSSVFAVSNGDISAPEIKLVKATGDMKGVVVTAKKPMVEVKADKTILNVEGTINAVGTDALELLRKSPGVSVDKDDNLSLSGKNGVQVYVDGRPSPLSGQDLANYLKSIQSSNIEAIELITNPSAKYEAAGNAGIINIRLKKNKSLGTNGSVNAGWNIGTFAKYNAGLALNYRNKSVNIFGNYGFNTGVNANRMNINRSIRDSSFDQHARMNNDNTSHNFKAGLDYFINKQSTVGVMVNGNFSDAVNTNQSQTAIIYKPTNTISRYLVADNRSTSNRDNVNVNLNYSFNAADGRSLVLNADHGYYNLNSDQNQPNYYYNASWQPLNNIIYEMITPTKINLSSVKADWEQNFKKGKLGFGGKAGYVTSDNDFQRYDVQSGSKYIDKDRSNRFKYTENINAAYVNYNRPFKGFMVQGGVRMESTTSKGTSNGLKKTGTVYNPYDSTFKRNYVDFFPSAAITFNKNPMKQVGFSYSRRIDRPYYQDLNPFESKLDEYTFQKGNIHLRPQYTNSFGMTYTYKYKLNMALNYSHVKDLFTQLIDTAEGSKAFISKQNLATQDIVSMNVSYPFQYKSYSLFGNLNTNYSHYKANYGTGRNVDINAFGLGLYAQNSLRFKKTWTAELTGFYNAPTVYQGNFKARALWAVDAGMQKQVLKGKGTIKASVSDIFNTLQFRATSDFSGQTTKFGAKWETRQFKLNFVYRFGSSQVKAARQRATGAEEEAKRTAGGNGGLSVGQ